MMQISDKTTDQLEEQALNYPYVHIDENGKRSVRYKQCIPIRKSVSLRFLTSSCDDAACRIVDAFFEKVKELRNDNHQPERLNPEGASNSVCDSLNSTVT